jgi:hypothetical protein
VFYRKGRDIDGGTRMRTFTISSYSDRDVITTRIYSSLQRCTLRDASNPAAC